MNTEDINEKRIRSIFRMLVALSRGNFSYKIKRTGCNDYLEALIMWFNMTVEELREILKHYSYINPRDSYRYLVQMSFVLDNQYRIRRFNAPVPDLLGYEEKTFNNNTPYNCFFPPGNSSWSLPFVPFPGLGTARETLRVSWSPLPRPCYRKT